MEAKFKRLLGAHMSIGGGVEKAPARGESVGCTAMQIFTKSSNNWYSKPLEDDTVKAWFENLEKTDISIVASHDSYLINLASPEKEKREKSLKAFIDEIERADKLGIPLLVFHPGSHLGTGEETGLTAVADCMNEAIDRTPDSKVVLTIETTAGQGTNLGWRFEHLAFLIDRMENRERVGVCVDTCHIFAAGYELRDEKSYKNTFQEFDKIIGLDLIRFFHLNDSKKDFGSRVDRHNHIGEGFLGKEPFRFLMNDRRFQKIPMVLETPKGKELKEDLQNLAVLHSLIKK